jgi:hypothetical protein
MGDAAHGKQDGRQEAAAGSGGQPQPGAGAPPYTATGGSTLPDSRPEVLVGAAFLGGLVAAHLLRRARR